MKKRGYIFSIILFILGLLVGGFVENRRSQISIETIFDYNSEYPILLTITEQEMEQKPQLLALFKQYGIEDTSVDLVGAKRLPENQKELLALLPAGSKVDYCNSFNEEVEIRYELEGVFYHFHYTETHVMKNIIIEYNKNQYSIINTDNKEFECNKID